MAKKQSMDKPAKKAKKTESQNKDQMKVGSDIKGIFGKRNATSDTTKMTFYVKNELIEKLYNFAYWDRYSVTEAFNIALSDGLKGKTTKPIKRS
ncbi:MAG: hypothetical protein E3K37_05450 [Candidatus Kuenenia sp.]|nr:hypothetical protein [Candidatus Kuenenia hertensis]